MQKTPILNYSKTQKKNFFFKKLSKYNDTKVRQKSIHTWPASWEICTQVKKQQFELDMEQQTGSKLGKEYVKAVSYHPAYLTYMQNTSWETLGWMKHKLESR